MTLGRCPLSIFCSRGTPPRVEEDQASESDYRVIPPSEADSYLRLIDSCITQLKAQGPSRTCNESKEEVQNSESDYRVIPPFCNVVVLK